MAYKDLCPDALEGEKPVYFCEVGEKMPKGSLLFYTKLGYVKKTDWKEYNILKYAFQAAKVNEGDEIIGIEQDDPDPTTTLFFVTAQGMCLNAYKNDVPTQGRISAGVRGINLAEGDYVVYAGQIDGEGEIIVATDGNTIKKVIASQVDPMARYRKGIKIVDLGKGAQGRLFRLRHRTVQVCRSDGRRNTCAGGHGRGHHHRGPHHQGQKHQVQKGLQGGRLLVDEVSQILKCKKGRRKNAAPLLKKRSRASLRGSV